MEETKMLKILDTIRILLEKNCLFEAKEYIRIEIENLKGITQKKCRNTKYFFGSYCKYCSNLNCSKNRNKEIV